MFFKSRSVSSILASFAKTIDELETHAVLSLTSAADRRQVAEQAAKEAEAHEAEAQAATNVAAKIKNLIG
jgi:hypothetical protein